jgi:maltooligosyltrehalose trehalohydrolase
MFRKAMFGPILLPGEKAEFRIWAPSVTSIALQVDDAPAAPMQARDRGWFSLVAPARPGSRYNFVLPDGLAVPDPASRAQADDVHGRSLLLDPDQYAWRHPEWRNRPWHEAVICEVHPGACGGFAGIMRRLDDWAQLGVTAIELMPIADFPGRLNWGYDGVLPYAPDRAYGTPEELKALVDAAHERGLMILLDVVYNHFGPDGAYLHAYAKDFFDADVHTPWGAAIDFKRPEVCAYFIDNALMWLNEYRFDGLRFDAVHAISPPDFLPQLAAAIREGAERPVHLVLEHEGNKSSLLLGPSAKLFDAQWADDWHHCLHVLLTGEQEGYYESFANPAEQLARAMAEGFVFQGEISPHHKAPRGEPSADLPPTAFVICLQNHDQIGNRAMGERLTRLADRRALAAATALLLLSPTIPMLFMGEEWGSDTPFLFFTDHNEELAKLVREGRRREFAHFAAFQDEARRAQIPDPNAASTFAASVPDPAEAEGAEHAATLALHRRLLALRHAHVVPGIVGCRSAGARALSASAVMGGWHLGNGTTLTIASNFGDQPVAFAQPEGRVIFSSGIEEADLSGRGGAGEGLLPPRTTIAILAGAA